MRLCFMASRGYRKHSFLCFSVNHWGGGMFLQLHWLFLKLHDALHDTAKLESLSWYLKYLVNRQFCWSLNQTDAMLPICMLNTKREKKSSHILKWLMKAFVDFYNCKTLLVKIHVLKHSTLLFVVLHFLFWFYQTYQSLKIQSSLLFNFYKGCRLPQEQGFFENNSLQSSMFYHYELGDFKRRKGCYKHISVYEVFVS